MVRKDEGRDRMLGLKFLEYQTLDEEIQTTISFQEYYHIMSKDFDKDPRKKLNEIT